MIMVDKRRRSFDDKENNFGGEHIENIEQLINYITSMFENNSSRPPDKPLVYGFTIIQNPGKKPEILGFKGPVPDISKIFNNQQILVGQKEPFVDILEAEDTLYLIADMGTDEENIEYYISDDSVEIASFAHGMRYAKTVELPVKVDPSSARSTCKNGVLEIALDIMAR
ncbi:putative heat shock protein [Methanosalsum zhilinae DSM 4017]|uniref:Putative heat shock protein n=2 Tax=Methanosalsum zhilinae TaxID=39669 RepID=F7XMG5_METZD|nr:putative heat shock protein [Methanosalsum zhilinae DSM 4017]